MTARRTSQGPRARKSTGRAARKSRAKRAKATTVTRKKAPVAKKKPRAPVKKAAKKRTRKATAKKPAARRAAKPAARRAAKPAARKPARKKAAAPTPRGIRIAATRSREVGRIDQAFARAGAAVLELSGELRTGDWIAVRGPTTDFTQKLESLRIDDREVAGARAGDVVGIATCERTRVGDRVERLDP